MNSKIIMFLLAASFGSQAHAAVTDVFDCKMAFVNSDGSESLSQANRVAVIRKPEGKRDGYVFSRGDARLALQTKANGVLRKVDVHFVIRHALQEDQTGSAVAFQSTSFSPDTFFCDKPTCLDNVPEAGTRTPGSPEQYGSRVAVISGVPAIDTNQIRESEMHFGAGPQDGVAKVACEHVGTYR